MLMYVPSIELHIGEYGPSRSSDRSLLAVGRGIVQHNDNCLADKVRSVDIMLLDSLVNRVYKVSIDLHSDAPTHLTIVH